MATYYDCIIFRDTKSGKKFARTIGSALQKDDGFDVYLDALPPDGKFCIRKQRERSYQRDQGAPPGQATTRTSEDEIPF